MGGASEGNGALTASLGSSLGPLGTGRSYSSAGTGTDRGCPWMTARNRWLGHVGGTAGENNADPSPPRWHQFGRRVRTVRGDHLPRGQAAKGGAAAVEWIRSRFRRASAVEDSLLVRATVCPQPGGMGQANAVFGCARLRGGTWNTRDHKPSRLREIFVANLAKTYLL